MTPTQITGLKDPDAFFKHLKANIKDGNGNPIRRLKQTQVEGFNVLLRQAYFRATPFDKLAYYLATAWWETGHTMQPVLEAFWVKNAEAWRRKNLRYYPYYGRGYVQLTWEANYRTVTRYFQQELGISVDFVKNPELVQRPAYAAIIMFVGMERGWFGKKLDDYLDGIDESDVKDREEFRNARRTVNIMDKADKIADLAIIFEYALKAGRYGGLTGKAAEVIIMDDVEDNIPQATAQKEATRITVENGRLVDKPVAPSPQPPAPKKQTLWAILMALLDDILRGGTK